MVGRWTVVRLLRIPSTSLFSEAVASIEHIVCGGVSGLPDLCSAEELFSGRPSEINTAPTE